jgi:hypothetical protein
MIRNIGRSLNAGWRESIVKCSKIEVRDFEKLLIIGEEKIFE